MLCCAVAPGVGCGPLARTPHATQVAPYSEYVPLGHGAHLAKLLLGDDGAISRCCPGLQSAQCT